MTYTFITTGKLLASSLVISFAFSTTAMAQVKSTSTAPQTEVENAQQNATSYGSTRSNKKMIAAPAGEMPDVGEAAKPANLDNKDREKRNSRWRESRSIAARAGCVTVDGAVDANCDGVDDAEAAKIDDRRRPRRPQPRQQRR